MHAEAVADEQTETDQYNIFADETWFCVWSLILAHVAAIEIYCVEKCKKINPRSLNTDVVERFFGDGRQMVGGSTNSMTARQWDHSSFKAQAFNVGMHNLKTNNATGED